MDIEICKWLAEDTGVHYELTRQRPKAVKCAESNDAAADIVLHSHRN